MDHPLNWIAQNVDESLKKSEFRTRPGAGSSPWIALLLPAVIVVVGLKEDNPSEILRFSAVLNFGLFVATALFIFQQIIAYKSFKTFSKLISIPAVLVFILLVIYLKEGILISIACGIAVCFSFYIGLPLLLEKCPLSFTFGEASIVLQATITFIITSFVGICRVKDPQYLSDIEKATVILQVGLLGCGLIILFVSYFSALKRFPGFYFAVLTVSLGFIFPLLTSFLGENPLLWIVFFIFSKTERVLMLLYWCCCSGLAVLAINSQLVKQKVASTIVRKRFHYLIVAVYIPGVVEECTLLYLSSGIVLAIFLVLDMIRIHNIPPLGQLLQKSFELFADEKDQGPVALTPIYLLAGCSLPLWIHPSCCSDRPERYLYSLAGILTVGVGDTAASIGGSHFGKHKWPGSAKSIEGTIISILCQYAVLIAFVCHGYIPASPLFLLRPFVVIIMTSILEAKTDQVDNLVLPLVQLLLLL